MKVVKLRSFSWLELMITHPPGPKIMAVNVLVQVWPWAFCFLHFLLTIYSLSLAVHSYIMLSACSEKKLLKKGRCWSPAHLTTGTQ